MVFCNTKKGYPILVVAFFCIADFVWFSNSYRKKIASAVPKLLFLNEIARCTFRKRYEKNAIRRIFGR